MDLEYLTEGKDFECAICLVPWTDPQELNCGHIFCRGCLTSLSTCPECREKIVTSKTPNRIMLNMVGALPVKCKKCGWKGTKERAPFHEGPGCVPQSTVTRTSILTPKPQPSLNATHVLPERPSLPFPPQGSHHHSVPTSFQPSSQQRAAPRYRCPQCSFENPPESDFCTNCYKRRLR